MGRQLHEPHDIGFGRTFLLAYTHSAVSAGDILLSRRYAHGEIFLSRSYHGRRICRLAHMRQAQAAQGRFRGRGLRICNVFLSHSLLAYRYGRIHRLKETPAASSGGSSRRSCGCKHEKAQKPQRLGEYSKTAVRRSDSRFYRVIGSIVPRSIIHEFELDIVVAHAAVFADVSAGRGNCISCAVHTADSVVKFIIGGDSLAGDFRDEVADF